jgi:hypothetical protein
MDCSFALMLQCCRASFYPTAAKPINHQIDCGISVEFQWSFQWHCGRPSSNLEPVMEYAAATYGPPRIPVLVAALNQHERTETLIPAVFGVSADEFEAGWQIYLSRDAP